MVGKRHPNIHFRPRSSWRSTNASFTEQQRGFAGFHHERFFVDRGTIISTVLSRNKLLSGIYLALSIRRILLTYYVNYHPRSLSRFLDPFAFDLDPFSFESFRRSAVAGSSLNALVEDARFDPDFFSRE